jgi:hypothetical protein
MFKGTYVFKENGIEIGRSKNLITTNGRTVLMKYLCGLEPDWASSIAIGAVNQNAPVESDTQLSFETMRVPVTLKTYQPAYAGSPDLVVVRGTLPANMYANIYEIGLFPQSVNSESLTRNNAILTDFTELTNWKTNVYDDTLSITNQGLSQSNPFVPQGIGSPRYGAYSVTISQNTIFSNNEYSTTLLGYSEVDTLDILAYNTVGGTLTVVLTDISGITATVEYSMGTDTSYQKLSANMPSSIRNFSNLQSIDIITDSTASLTIDAIKTSAFGELSSSDYIISRSTLSTPIAKTYNTALDIEYFIELL